MKGGMDSSDEDFDHLDSILESINKERENLLMIYLEQPSHTLVISEILKESEEDEFSEEIKKEMDCKRPSIILKLKTEEEKLQSFIFTCILQGEYIPIPYSIMDKVYIRGNFNKRREILITTLKNKSEFFSNNFLILEPEIYLNPTSITLSFPCYRKVMLSTYFIPRDLGTEPMVLGKLMHEVFEKICQASAISLEALKEIFNQCVASFIEDITYFGWSETKLWEENEGTFIEILKWHKSYILDGERLKIPDESQSYKILRVIESESEILSNSLGIKGIIDMVLLCEVTKKNGETKNEFIPFELKTGKRESHFYNAQVLFYSLLLMQKYNQIENINGLIYYLRLQKLLEVKIKSIDGIHLLIRRNHLAKHIKNFEYNQSQFKLPSMITNFNDCNHCQSRQFCIGVKLCDIEDSSEFQVHEKFTDYYKIKSFLSEPRKIFIKKWLELIQLEESIDTNRKRFSLELSEKNGQIFVLKSILELKEAIDFENNVFKSEVLSDLRLKFSKCFQSKADCMNYFDEFKNSEVITLSEDFFSIRLKAIVEEKRIGRNSSNKRDDKYYFEISIKIISQEGTSNKLDMLDVFLNTDDICQLKWKITKFERSFFATMRGNVLNLALSLEHHSMGEFLIENKVAQFDESTEKSEEISSLISNLKYELNEDQKFALKKVLSANEFALILGMPGTGKTFLLSIIIKALQKQGNTLLICSYTNSALDNILIKTLENFPEVKDSMLRFSSNISSVNPQLADIAYTKNFKTVAEFTSFLKSKKIIGCTNLSVYRTLIGWNIFFNSALKSYDYVIMDEASQCVEPLAIGPLILGKKFVLIGDHYQLEPLVKNPEASEKGMSISLFERLCKLNQHAISSLRTQYRMNEDIMKLSNTLIYNGMLRPGNSEVANGRLIKNENSKFDQFNQPFIKDCLNPDIPVIFCDTDLLRKSKYIKDLAIEITTSFQVTPGKNSKSKSIDKKIEEIELLLVKRFVKELMDNFVLEAKDIGVLTLFNEQRIKLLLKLKVSKSYSLKISSLEVLTIDKSQGLDKECFILLFSKLDATDMMLQNWRRYNVAFTRAKKKLILIGSSSTLRSHNHLNILMKMLEDDKKVKIVEDDLVKDLIANN